MIMTTMNLTWKIYEFFLDDFLLCFEFESPAHFSVMQNQNKIKTGKREEFLSNSNSEFEVTQVQ